MSDKPCSEGTADAVGGNTAQHRGTRLRRWWPAPLAVALLWPAADALAQSCPPAPEQGQLCAAKDFTISNTIIAGPTACTDGEVVSVRVRVGLLSTANQRYDIGIFAGENGEPVFGGASCSLDALVPLEPDPPFDADSGAGGYRNLDGDACGDIRSADGEVFKDIQLDNVLCQDTDGDGQVNISGLVTWSSNASQDVCSDPANPVNFFPSSSSKCILDPEFNLPIIVEPPPSLRVFKLALPGNLPEPGGPVLFGVYVRNTSASTDVVTITGITDDVHGNVTSAGGNITRTSCAVPQTLVAGQSYLCEFVAPVTGPTGYVEFDTVTVTGQDDEGTPVSATDMARVEIGNQPASIIVRKSANPTLIPEPGGPVTYSVLVANASDTESVTIETLVDDLYGTLSGMGSCPPLPFTLAPGQAMRCEFTETVSGDFGDPPVVDVITADGPGIDAASATAAVAFDDVPASIAVSKIAVPESLPEPGGTFQFEIRVQNTSPVDDITITSIIDNVYGDLNGRGSCATGALLTPGQTYSCSFDGDFSGPPGAVQVDLVFVQATDSDGGRESHFASAEVFIEDVPSTLAVTKTPDVSQQVAGGPVTYTVTVYNTSPVDTINLNSLVDQPYGDVTVVANAISATTCSLPVMLAPGANYVCEFTATVSGAPGDIVVDTVFATGEDELPNIVIGSDSAEVAIIDNTGPPTQAELVVTKVARPAAVPVTDVPVQIGYLVRIFNPNDFDVRVLSAMDDIYDILGNDPSRVPIASRLSCPLPFDLAAQSSRACVFTAPVNGNVGEVITDIVTVDACILPDCAEMLSASDDASVTITAGPLSLAVLKTASPTSVVTPGGPVTFSVEVINTSDRETLTLVALGDDIYGDITSVAGDISSTSCSVPQLLPPAGGRYQCSFSADVNGVAGTEVIDIVTATAEDSGGLQISDADSARVKILGELPRVELTKTVTPSTVVAPGGTVSFTTLVRNTSATETLTISSLVDDIYGDLNGQGTCSIPQTLAPTATYTCRFAGEVTGTNAGLHRDTITLQGRDESGDPVADSDWAVVFIIPLGGAGGTIAIPVSPAWLVLIASLGLAGIGAAALVKRRRWKR